MTCRATLLLSGLLLCVPRTFAQIPAPPIEAAIDVSNPNPFEKETFFITLSIITRGIDIRQQLDLANLPEAGRIALVSNFEPLPIQREVDGPLTTETRRYQARARAMVPGPTPIAPLLRLTARHHTRSLFGSIVEERPVSLEIPPVTVNAKPLPPPPDDFSGAVGAFTVEFTLSPTNLVAGDLITITTQISGEGWLENLRIPEVPEAPLLKAYAVKDVKSDPRQRCFAQTVIPKSTAVLDIPALQLTVFDTGKGQYVTHTAGPFPLCYHAAQTRVVEQFRPDGQTGTGDGETNAGGAAVRLKERIAAGGGVSAVCAIESAARLAPSVKSLTTFTVPAESAVQVLDRYGEWILIDHHRSRGWIHESALSNDRH